MTEKPKRMTVLLPESEFERFGRYCRKYGFKKSTLIRRLLLDCMDAAGFETQRGLPLQQDSPALGEER